MWCLEGSAAMLVRVKRSDPHEYFQIVRNRREGKRVRQTVATICGHVFCSLLAPVLRDAHFRRMERAGVTVGWADVPRDLNALTETVIAHDGKRFAVRSAAVGVAGKIAQCDGVRLPKAVRRIEEENAGTSA